MEKRLYTHLVLLFLDFFLHISIDSIVFIYSVRNFNQIQGRKRERETTKKKVIRIKPLDNVQLCILWQKRLYHLHRTVSFAISCITKWCEFVFQFYCRMW